MIRTDREAFIARTEELAARLSRISQPLPPNMVYNQGTGKWEAPQPRTPQPIDGYNWDYDDNFSGDDYCTPSRRTRLTAQPQAVPKPIVYAQYDSRYDVELHPELDAPAPQPAKLVPAPLEPEGIPVDWPTRIVQPVPLSARR